MFRGEAEQVPEKIFSWDDAFKRYEQVFQRCLKKP
jgi:hypothetical protein